MDDLEGIQQNTFCTVNQYDASSLKADILAIKWLYTPTNGGPAIPGYHPLFFSILALLFTSYLLRKNKTRLKEK
jgi:hypothetical protein